MCRVVPACLWRESSVFFKTMFSAPSYRDNPKSKNAAEFQPKTAGTTQTPGRGRLVEITWLGAPILALLIRNAQYIGRHKTNTH